jgi:regulator of protease activity HflC (stomatin/prohibitin superfamily)
MDNTIISFLSFLLSLEFLAFAFIAFMLNFSIILVPQNSVSVVERFRKFRANLHPGLNFVMPFIDKVVVNRSLKEQLIHIPSQKALTKDNINVMAQGILHYRILNPYKSTYAVENYICSLTQLTQATFRSELSKLKLYNSFESPDCLNKNIIESLNESSKSWGIQILGYEIKEISLPPGILEEMEGRMRINLRAERDKQVLITESEAQKQSVINIAEGRKQVQILEAEATKVVNSLKIEPTEKNAKSSKNVEEIFAQRH